MTISDDEYRWLRALYLESLKVRDQGLMAFNRLPPPMRLAIVSLALHYKDCGRDDRGAP